MANFLKQLERWGLAKETTRGTAEAAPSVWLAVSPESKMDLKEIYLPDVALRGVMSRYADAAVYKEGDGIIKFPLRASDIGEIVHMLLGDPTSAQQGGTTAYLHTWTPANTLLPQSYTVFVDRSLNVLKYNGCNVSELKITGTPEDFIQIEAKMMFLNEASGSIGSPSYVESEEMTFQHVTFKIAGTSSTEVKQFECTIKNGLFRKRVTAQVQTPEQLVATMLSADVSFTVYFEDATERDKFIAGTASSIEIVCTGDTISGAFTYTFEVLLDSFVYTAFPYEAEDGLLAAKVVGHAVYNTSNSRIMRVRATNITTAY